MFMVVVPKAELNGRRFLEGHVFPRSANPFAFGEFASGRKRLVSPPGDFKDHRWEMQDFREPRGVIR